MEAEQIAIPKLTAIVDFNAGTWSNNFSLLADEFWFSKMGHESE